MRQVIKTDKKRDIGYTLQGLAPDKNSMIESHVVPSTAADVVYNDISEIGSVGNKVCDTFDAIQVSQYLHYAGVDARNAVNPSGEELAK